MRLIDADALIENILALPNCSNSFSDTYDKDCIIGVIDEQPTIERKTGEWEEREVSSDKVIDEWQSARCSVCGLYHTTPYMYFFDNYKFCPNCGADMRGE